MRHDEPMDDNQFNALRAHEVDGWEDAEAFWMHTFRVVRFLACCGLIAALVVSWIAERK